MAQNPLRYDPTRTGVARRAFMRDVTARWKKLRRAIKDFIYAKDALGLKSGGHLVLHASPQPRQYQFLTSAQKVSAFRQWLIEQVKADLLSVPPGQDASKPWTSPYVLSGYRKGLEAAYGKTPSNRKDAVFGTTSKAEFMRTAFNQPETTRKIELLYTRTWENMQGVTDTIGSKLSSLLAQGLADGRGAGSIAKDLMDGLDWSQSRAMTVARTEVIHSHAEGSLDAYENLGVEELGVDVEFSTAHDDAVCPECADLDGRIYSPEEARGVIPVHPNCRCAWVPAVSKPGEKKAEDASKPEAGKVEEPPPLA